MFSWTVGRRESRSLETRLCPEQLRALILDGHLQGTQTLGHQPMEQSSRASGCALAET